MLIVYFVLPVCVLELLQRVQLEIFGRHYKQMSCACYK